MNIIKRSGEEQVFDPKKIVVAISKANVTVPEREQLSKYQIENILESIVEQCEYLTHNGKTPTVEEVQDMVENRIMASSCYSVARNYITYRYLRKLARDKYKDLMAKVADKLTAKHVVNQNANVDEFSFGGRTGETASVITKEYALNFLMSNKARTAHNDNTIYTHDLDSFSVGMHNCLSVPVDYLLKHGFNTRQTDVRPAKSINTAFQLLAVLFQLQSLQQFGGVSATHLDWTMVPYMRFSFFKHYLLNYLKTRDDFDELEILNMTSEELDDWIDSHKKEYLNKFGLSLEDFKFDNKESPKLDKHFFKAALFDTAIELKQAIEGMYHNLNFWVA